MHPLLEKVCETKTFINSRNETVTVHSETSVGQCMFLQDIIRKNGLKASVEIGLAYGTSTLAIAEAVVENGGRSVAIDPYENSYWGGNGLDLVKQAGYEGSLEFFEDFSYITLSRFLEQGRKFDFAYIDSTKLLDWLMVDFFLLDKLLEINGIIVFDDVNYPSIRKLLRYLSQFPHYEVCGQYPLNKKLSAMRKILKTWLLPRAIRREEMRIKDYRLGIYTHSIALRKKGNDERKYDWHVQF